MKQHLARSQDLQAALRHVWFVGGGSGGSTSTLARRLAATHDLRLYHGYFQLMREVVRRYGIPLAVYSDRQGIFFKTKDQALTLEEALAGRREPTQFGRLLEELGIELILARSPQGKLQQFDLFD